MRRDLVRLEVGRLGRRGEGVAMRDGGAVYVPYALPGEAVLAECTGERATVVELLSRRSDRVVPVCPYYGTCGGCAVQTLPSGPYGAWKRDLVTTALARAGLDAPVEPLVDAHGLGRRRATFHARLVEPGAPPRVGFMAARAHTIVDLDVCPILEPAMAGALGAARRIAAVVSQAGKPLDLLVTATDGGLDLDLRGLGPVDAAQRTALVSTAGRADLARLSNHGEVLVENRSPDLNFGRAKVHLPPGAFLQSTRAGEAALAALVLAGVGEARAVADLFSGVGTFALRLAEKATVVAVDLEPRSVAALSRAARGTSGLREVRVETRDLFGRPLTAEELDRAEAVVFDPPRSGAATQAAELARSAVPRVVAVSCDPGTFARDAATLVAGGYRLERVVPVDQFRYSPHVEIVATFSRPQARSRKRRLLS